MSTTRSEGVAHVATTFGGETCAEAMREAARFVARCERGISDIIVGTNDDGEPIVTVYEELERTDANTIACQLVEEFAPTDDGVHDWSRLRQMIADAIMQPLKGV